MIIALVVRLLHKGFHLLAQCLDVSKGCACTDREGEAFFHSLALGNVVNPIGIVDVIGNLDHGIIVDTTELGIEEGDFVDNEFRASYGDSVAYVVGVLYEHKDTGAKKLGCSRAQHEGKAGERGPDSIVVLCKIATKECRLMFVSTRLGIC